MGKNLAVDSFTESKRNIKQHKNIKHLPNPGINQSLLHLHWQADSVALAHLRSPIKQHKRVENGLTGRAWLRTLGAQEGF